MSANSWASHARRLRSESTRQLAGRVARRAYHRLGAAELDFPLLPGDWADSDDLALPDAPPVGVGPLTVGWLCSPPGPGSGGHTTLFRMVRAVERAGHRCVILLYDRHQGDLSAQRAVIERGWPDLRATVRNVEDGFEGLDACVASAWPTAHVLARRAAPVHRFYFIQDFEPYFYPRGAEWELAADTYRFGFTNIALGRMVHDCLINELAVDSDTVPFSVDTDVYRLESASPRNGVVLYAKPGVPRRGYLLAARALEEFHRLRPNQEITVYGDPVPELTIPVTRRGRMSPEDLNTLYNRAIAGLAISFTNITLVAEELLASGAVPVINDCPEARAGLNSPAVAWARPTPTGLAQALCRVVDHDDLASQAQFASATASTDNWERAGRGVVEIIESRARAAAPSFPRWQ